MLKVKQLQTFLEQDQHKITQYEMQSIKTQKQLKKSNETNKKLKQEIQQLKQDSINQSH